MAEMPPPAAHTLIDRAGLSMAVADLADAVAADLSGSGPVFLAGIPTRGVSLARRLKARLDSCGLAVGCGAVDISMYRDDLGMRGGVAPLRGTELPMNLDNWIVVLVDDVQQTGRTVRAAIDAVLGFGRPKRILFAVLVDRGGRELPIRPDYTALKLDVRPEAKLRVRLAEVDDGEEGIFAS